MDAHPLLSKYNVDIHFARQLPCVSTKTNTFQCDFETVSMLETAVRNFEAFKGNTWKANPLTLTYPEKERYKV